MKMRCDRWSVLKLFEVILVLICLVFKRVTDDEASRVFLYLQRISREWSLLNNITWSRVGAALADATYGGYLIITFALFMGRLFGELPTERRISEYILLGIGAILFIVLGSLSYAAIDSVPHDLVDNAAIVGTVSLVTAALFLLDMGGPKAKKPQKEQIQTKKTETKNMSYQSNDAEKQLEKPDKKQFDLYDKSRTDVNGVMNGVKSTKEKHSSNGHTNVVTETELPRAPKGYQQMTDDFPRKYGIYGRDGRDGSDTEETDDIKMPPRMQSHSHIWSNIRQGRQNDFLAYG